MTTKSTYKESRSDVAKSGDKASFPDVAWSAEWVNSMSMRRKTDRYSLYPQSCERPPSIVVAETMSVLQFARRDDKSMRVVLLNRSEETGMKWTVFSDTVMPLAYHDDSAPKYWVESYAHRPMFHLVEDVSGTAEHLNEMFQQL